MKTCQKCGALYESSANVCSACGSEDLAVAAKVCAAAEQSAPDKKSVSANISAILGFFLPIILGIGYVVTKAVSVILTVATAIVNILFLLSGAAFILVIFLGTLFSFNASSSEIFAFLTSLMSIALIITVVTTIAALVLAIVVNIASALIIPAIDGVSNILGILALAAGALGIVLSTGALIDKHKLGSAGIIASAASIVAVITVTALSTLISIPGGIISAVAMFAILMLI